MLEGRERNDAVKALAVEGRAGDSRAEGRRDRHPALAVDLVDESVDEQCHRPVPPWPSDPVQTGSMGGGTDGGAGRPGGAATGSNGISWVSMGVNGISPISVGFS